MSARTCLFITFASCILATGPFAQPGWTIRNPSPTIHTLNSIAWNGEYLAAVGNAGTILTSRDGIDWSARSNRTDADWSSIVWAGSQWMAVGAGRDTSTGDRYGLAATSSDGITWTRRSAGTTATLHSVAWTGSVWVALSQDPMTLDAVILTSPDGSQWRSIAPAPSSPGKRLSLASLAWTGNRMVAVGTELDLELGEETSAASTSPDGFTWTSRNLGTPGGLKAVTWTGSQLVAVGNSGSGCVTSPDGVTWTQRKAEVGANNSVAWTGRHLISAGGGSDSSIVVSSPDGVEWTRRATGEAMWLNSVVWTGGQAVAVGQAGLVMTSPDGITWNSRRSKGIGDFFSMAWTGSQFVAVGSEYGRPWGIIATSPDGTRWTRRNPDTTMPWLHSVVWTGKNLVAVGKFGAVLTSQDGIDWVRRLSDSAIFLHSIIWNGRELMAAGAASGDSIEGNNGLIMTSPDGAAWSSRKLLPSSTLYSVAWSGAQYAVVGARWDALGEAPRGTIFTSPDGLAWTPRQPDSAGSLYTVAWTGSRWVAAGGYGAILTSEDGLEWISRTPKDNLVLLLSVISTGRQVVAVGSKSTGGFVAFHHAMIMTSPDGVAWTQSVLPHWPLQSVIWTGTQVVAVGWRDLVLTSPDGNSDAILRRSKESGRISLRLTGSHLHASLPPSLRHPATRARVFCLTGRKLIEVPAGGSGTDIALPIGGLSRGAYLLDVRGPGGTQRAAFVK